ncbi:hypothetical protein MUK42_18001 [Musa troglodytarum]|uniref:Protein-ribulosamine 3-kinase n=1 Tax=Musa troglodytarum TaxID=320322 RepID=A0A9E7L0P2_9LILI|nr:hypothetical protein MUK42_18001 [Musa troglodytarum]
MVHVGAPLSAPSFLGASTPRARRRASLLPNLTRRRSIMASLGDDPIREWILTEGKATQITRISPIGGGCINHASRYDTDSGYRSSAMSIIDDYLRMLEFCEQIDDINE